MNIFLKQFINNFLKYRWLFLYLWTIAIVVVIFALIVCYNEASVMENTTTWDITNIKLKN